MLFRLLGHYQINGFVDVLPPLALRLLLTQKGRGFLPPASHVRDGECYWPHCGHDHVSCRNADKPIPLFQDPSVLSGRCVPGTQNGSVALNLIPVGSVKLWAIEHRVA